ncbi:DNA sulfur modification protein DndB [Arcicella aurantiaca]|uniref:DNA sulfur modification protein DndB n=1 Tax=Arcicella aurantiaca TaxID=591202 RepID=A0A316DHR8_9BACT|nr:DNA sulfur modification protein DndB [Arcicella aurantiaca]PWK17188.1 DNA sulfur modification protein DndB [Arcicella aurantiaca]
MMNKNIYLPSLTGKFGQWRYYQTVMKVSDIVENLGTNEKPDFRIKTVEEVEEIYSKKGVNNLLQRAFDPTRLVPITNYLLSQTDKYINNLTVAIFGGNPDWLTIDVDRIGQDDSIDDDSLEYFEKAFGVVKLTGTETLFVLDGQHRLKGLRNAILQEPTIGEQTVGITLIIHEDSDLGRERTRRLFSTINRHAKPVSLGENILLDEDDLSAIIVRKLIEEHPLFKGKELIAYNKAKNLNPSQFNDKFTTVLTLYSINEVLIDNDSVYKDFKNVKVRIRPDDNVIESWQKVVFSFWDKFFECFSDAKEFVNGTNPSLGLERKNGGKFYLRPLGQEAFALLYSKLKKENNLEKLTKISLIEPNIENEFWHYTFWNPSKNNIINSGLPTNYLLYHFGLLGISSIKKLKEGYIKNSGNIKHDIPEIIIK